MDKSPSRDILHFPAVCLITESRSFLNKSVVSVVVQNNMLILDAIVSYRFGCKGSKCLLLFAQFILPYLCHTNVFQNLRINFKGFSNLAHGDLLGQHMRYQMLPQRRSTVLCSTINFYSTLVRYSPGVMPSNFLKARASAKLLE